ncbi:unnamed protein product [Lampetra planeri]
MGNRVYGGGVAKWKSPSRVAALLSALASAASDYIQQGQGVAAAAAAVATTPPCLSLTVDESSLTIESGVHLDFEQPVVRNRSRRATEMSTQVNKRRKTPQQLLAHATRCCRKASARGHCGEPLVSDDGGGGACDDREVTVALRSVRVPRRRA